VFVLATTFSLRPLLGNPERTDVLHGVDVSSGTLIAEVIGLIAMLAFVIGSLLRDLPRRSGETRDRVSSTLASCVGWSKSSFNRTARTSLIVLLSGYIATVVWVRRPLFFIDTLAGRSAELTETITGVPIFFLLAPIVAALILGRERAMWSRGWIGARQEFIYWAIPIFAAIPSLAVGARRLLIPTILIAALGAVWHRLVFRPKAVHVGLAFLFLLVLFSIPFVRSAGARLEGESVAGAVQRYYLDGGPKEAVLAYLETFDTESYAFTSLIASNDFDLGTPSGGRWIIGDVLLGPVPNATLDRAGIPLTSDAVLVKIYGTTCSTGACPIPSLPGVLLYDFGSFGVAAGMFAWGWIISGRRLRLGELNTDPTAALLVAGFAPVVVRGDPAKTIVIAGGVWVGAWIALRFRPPADDSALASSLTGAGEADPIDNPDNPNKGFTSAVTNT
jgi:hypothetical protein